MECSGNPYMGGAVQHGKRAEGVRGGETKDGKREAATAQVLVSKHRPNTSTGSEVVRQRAVAKRSGLLPNTPKSHGSQREVNYCGQRAAGRGHHCTMASASPRGCPAAGWSALGGTTPGTGGSATAAGSPAGGAATASAGPGAGAAASAAGAAGAGNPSAAGAAGAPEDGSGELLCLASAAWSACVEPAPPLEPTPSSLSEPETKSLEVEGRWQVRGKLAAAKLCAPQSRDRQGHQLQSNNKALHHARQILTAAACGRAIRHRLRAACRLLRTVAGGGSCSPRLRRGGRCRTGAASGGGGGARRRRRLAGEACRLCRQHTVHVGLQLPARLRVQRVYVQLILVVVLLRGGKRRGGRQKRQERSTVKSAGGRTCRWQRSASWRCRHPSCADST